MNTLRTRKKGIVINPTHFRIGNSYTASVAHSTWAEHKFQPNRPTQAKSDLYEMTKPAMSGPNSTKNVSHQAQPPEEQESLQYPPLYAEKVTTFPLPCLTSAFSTLVRSVCGPPEGRKATTCVLPLTVTEQ